MIVPSGSWLSTSWPPMSFCFIAVKFICSWNVQIITASFSKCVYSHNHLGNQVRNVILPESSLQHQFASPRATSVQISTIIDYLSLLLNFSKMEFNIFSMTSCILYTGSELTMAHVFFFFNRVLLYCQVTCKRNFMGFVFPLGLQGLIECLPTAGAQ